LRERSRELRRHAFREIDVARVATDVDEWKHGDGFGSKSTCASNGAGRDRCLTSTEIGAGGQPRGEQHTDYTNEGCPPPPLPRRSRCGSERSELATHHGWIVEQPCDFLRRARPLSRILLHHAHEEIGERRRDVITSGRDWLRCFRELSREQRLRRASIERR